VPDKQKMKERVKNRMKEWEDEKLEVLDQI
jgi:hypothetical protein